MPSSMATTATRTRWQGGAPAHKELICEIGRADEHQGGKERLAHAMDWQEAQRRGLATVRWTAVALWMSRRKTMTCGRLR